MGTAGLLGALLLTGPGVPAPAEPDATPLRSATPRCAASPCDNPPNTGGFEPIREVPKVLIVPTRRSPPRSDQPPLDDYRLNAFSEALSAAAAEVFQWRRFEVVGGAGRDVRSSLPEDRCHEAICYDRAARALGASHWVSSKIVQMRAPHCRVRVVLQDLIRGSRAVVLERDVKPCEVDPLLAAARHLGREIARGSRAPTPMPAPGCRAEDGCVLTELEIAGIDVPDVPDVDDRVPTSSATRAGLDLDRALSLYRNKHMALMAHDDDPKRFSVTRAGAIIGECDVRRAASAPIGPELLEHCDGNDWEWAWLGVIPGAGVALATLPALPEGEAGVVWAFSFGVTTAMVSAGLALLLNVDAADPERGEYRSSRQELEQIVRSSNRDLRRSARLSEAEVEVAGMPR